MNTIRKMLSLSAILGLVLCMGLATGCDKKKPAGDAASGKKAPCCGTCKKEVKDAKAKCGSSEKCEEKAADATKKAGDDAKKAGDAVKKDAAKATDAVKKALPK